VSESFSTRMQSRTYRATMSSTYMRTHMVACGERQIFSQRARSRSDGTPSGQSGIGPR
jgi:hypothetical protein